MDEKPSVLFMSSSNLHPSDIIKMIFDENDLPDFVEIDEDIKAYPWHIDNKYYNTDVNLCALGKKKIANRNFADTVEAVVIYFDSSVDTGLETVETWLPFINEYEAEIKILVCRNCKDDNNEGCTKRSVQEWCINKEFELVELEPIVDEDEDVEDDFPETTGIKRIVQALNAHVWPNLVMKGASSLNRANGKPENPEKRATANDDTSELNRLRNELGLEESLEELLENDNDFSELFSQLPEMKAKVSALSGNERRAAAEQVVKAFWRALGGEMDEEILDV